MRKQTKVVAVASAAALLAIGGAMTSFAAQGWVEEDGTWYYYDKDGNRVEDEWRKSGDNWFWLDSEEGGAMATDKLIEDDDDTYYVDGNGVMVTNTWVKVVNEDQDDDDDPAEYHYYYMQSNGKAYKAETNDMKKKTVPDSTGSRTYFFDSEGHMISGWVEYEGDTYYCGSENEGWAYTGWQYLEPDEDKNSENYDDQEWFNFKSSGKARTSATWYSKGRYYTFDENGVMTSDWYDLEVASNTLGVATGTNGGENAYTSEYGSKGTGWVYTENAEESDSYWYYLVSFTGKDKNDKTVTMRNIPFNSQSGDGKMRAKVIKSKTYIFNDKGEMQDGLVTLTTNTPADNKGGAISKELKAGTYYFNEGNGSVNGQMVTGKTTVTKDGEDYYYYFDTKTGRAITNVVKDGVVYGPISLDCSSSRNLISFII